MSPKRTYTETKERKISNFARSFVILLLLGVLPTVDQFHQTSAYNNPDETSIPEPFEDEPFLSPSSTQESSVQNSNNTLNIPSTVENNSFPSTQENTQASPTVNYVPTIATPTETQDSFPPITPTNDRPTPTTNTLRPITIINTIDQLINSD
ncbi:hypothetical protein LRY65_01180 [Candidatus Woesebacteria bacterium]|nr:hypothetical protein [Candidatus Woesebacteria bacterium]MCD8507198.1 hypothetical protein [Candidatus Woesebacteria bacterium]MCD8526806.1 hypothetical protein [Candidatus Woesebacteria bacterium]MCD8545973.1 hypothetical protein [Candidatus Woesebacteria bacterium]